MSGAYYNEFDPFAAAWLRNLIKAGHIADGDVDERSIADVDPIDLLGYTQCHFFAGIGGWSYALRLAGWPDGRAVWTGSCPCQPFSNIGKRRGFNDERHLWPAWRRLIREHRPVVVLGEQVKSALGWLDLVSDDLEGLGYALGAACIPAAGVGAEHVRDRLWFVADADETGWQDAERIAATEAGAEVREATGVASGARYQHFRGTAKPDPSWIVDGLSGEGFAVGAYGNAIVPQVAAEFIGAYLDARP